MTQFLGVGGLEKILFILINEQMKQGHEVDLLVYDYEQSWVQYFKEHGINVISDYRKKTGYDLKLLIWLNGIVPKYDVVHTHDLNPAMYTAPLKILRRAMDKDFPVLIHTAHGMDHTHKRPITLLYEKLCATICDAAIGVSPAIVDVYKKDLLVPSDKVININNGTMTPQIQIDKQAMRDKLRSNLGIKNNHPIWIYVARVLPLKNHQYIMEAVRDIQNINMIFVGPSGDDHYWDTLKRDIPSHVYLTGSRSDINDLLLGSDFYISASTHEGIPVAVLEAGAMKLPCLLSDIPGHRILGDAAEYFSLTDIRILKSQIIKMNQSSQMYRHLSEKVFTLVQKSFSSEKMAQSYMSVYESHL